MKETRDTVQQGKDPTPERIMQMAWGYTGTLIIEAALHHHYFDLLEAGPKTAAQVADESKTSLRGATATLDALVGLQFLSREKDRYALTPESAAFLVSTKPEFHGTFFRHTVDQLLPKWTQLREVVRTGQPATAVNDRQDGATFFAEFVESLFPLSYGAARTFGEHLGLRKAVAPVSVLDLGAGSGVWGIALAELSPKVRIRAVDWPEVLKVTQRVAATRGVADRLTLVPGDLLEADFGSGHQVAALGHILHSEGVERSRRLLRKIHEALAPGGTLAIMEFLPNDERTGPPQPLIFAVNMLVNTDQGNAFTFAEISAWLKEAGFVNPRLLEVPAVSPLIVANKPGS